MSSPRMDPSLAEVREWREGLQAELGHLDAESRIREINRRASEIMRRHGLNLTTVDKEASSTGTETRRDLDHAAA